MAEDIETIIAEGRYFWQLVFSYDNSNNTGEIKQTYNVSRQHLVNSKQFMSSKFNINSGFTFDNKSSASLKFEGIGEGSDSVEFNFHLDTAYELQKTSEDNETIDEKNEETRDYTIGAHGKLSVYQLCYTTDGVELKTDTFASEPTKDAFVKLKFSCHKRILGLAEILDLFSHTFPGSANIQEWSRIRDSIIQNSPLSALDQFKGFVETLGGITRLSTIKSSGRQ